MPFVDVAVFRNGEREETSPTRFNSEGEDLGEGKPDDFRFVDNRFAIATEQANGDVNVMTGLTRKQAFDKAERLSMREGVDAVFVGQKIVQR